MALNQQRFSRRRRSASLYRCRLTGTEALDVLSWPDLAAIATHSISIAVVLEAAGIVFFIYALQAGDGEFVESLRSSALRIAFAAVLLTIIQHIVGPARLAASFSGIFDWSLQTFYLQSDAGIAHCVRLASLLAIIAGLINKNRSVTIVGAIVACLSFVMMGHTVTHSPRWLLSLLLAIHVAIVAFWFGSLRPLRGFTDDNRAEFAAHLELFSRLATRMVPFIFIAGLGLTVLLLGSFEKLTTPYGLMIIAKVTGFALLMALASFNRWRLLPGIGSGDVQAIATFRNVALIEWITITAIIITTVSVTSLFSP